MFLLGYGVLESDAVTDLMTPPSSPLLALTGAVPAADPDAAVAGHYGDPFAEQRLLSAGQGFVDLSHRPVIRVDGPDRLTWLHSLTTQHLESLAPGVATETLILSPHGHVEHALTLVDDGVACWIHLEPGTSEELLAFLTRMRFMLRVDVTDVTSDVAVIAELAFGARRESLIPRSLLADHAARRRPIGLDAWEALRVAAVRPRGGFETDHRTIPHEVNWLTTAVHLDKGCYRGQETVARVHNLGRPPRRLVMLHLDGSGHVLPSRGSAVHVEGVERQVGFVTTVARHYELGPIALALIKRSVDTTAPLLAEGIAAAQDVAVPPQYQPILRLLTTE
jgi:tRNA-modifying protein YgfZ